jgi:hypothetical protein
MEKVFFFVLEKSCGYDTITNVDVTGNYKHWRDGKIQNRANEAGCAWKGYADHLHGLGSVTSAARRSRPLV